MKINRLLLALATFLIVIVSTRTASAQANSDMKNKTPEQKAQGLTMIMKMKLNLDSAQVAKVQPINLKYLQGIDALKNSSEGKLAKYKQFKSISKTNETDLKAVLTPDQFKQYQAMEEEMKEKMKERKDAATGN